MQTLGIVGAGAWGTALGQIFAQNGRTVKIWAHEKETVEQINTTHENANFLKGVHLHDSLSATNALYELAGSDILLVVTPCQFVRGVLENLKGKLPEGKPVVMCSKGIEQKTGMLMSQVAEEVVPKAQIAIMTGPTFASEIANGLPSAVTIATADNTFGRQLQQDLGIKHFRPYLTDDVTGAQLAGAIKNVIAIACGIVIGKKMGDSARAALLTRGVAEIARLANAMGGKKETLFGMCGMGDLMLTCSSMQSRNYSLGVALGEGKSLEDVLKSRSAVTEGVHTAKAALALASKNAVDMPITEAVSKFLDGSMTINDAIEDMLNRPFKFELSKSKSNGKH